MSRRNRSGPSGPEPEALRGAGSCSTITKRSMKSAPFSRARRVREPSWEPALGISWEAREHQGGAVHVGHCPTSPAARRALRTASQSLIAEARNCRHSSGWAASKAGATVFSRTDRSSSRQLSRTRVVRAEAEEAKAETARSADSANGLLPVPMPIRRHTVSGPACTPSPARATRAPQTVCRGASVLRGWPNDA